MARFIPLSASLLGVSVLSFGAAAQSAAPSPPADASSDNDATALAKKLQNPIGDLYSVPFRNNTNFNSGPNKGTQDILNIRRCHITQDWNIITGTILPLVWSPSFQPAQSVPFGLAPTTFSAFFSPKNPVDGWVWGVGPIAELPTITSKTLGSNVRSRSAGGGRKASWSDRCRRADQQRVLAWRHFGPRGMRHSLHRQSILPLQFRRGLICRHKPHHNRELANRR